VLCATVSLPVKVETSWKPLAIRSLHDTHSTVSHTNKKTSSRFCFVKLQTIKTSEHRAVKHILKLGKLITWLRHEKKQRPVISRPDGPHSRAGRSGRQKSLPLQVLQPAIMRASAPRREAVYTRTAAKRARSQDSGIDVAECPVPSPGGPCASSRD
jgi:hypothetical protein